MTDRQEKLKDYSQEAQANAKIIMIGGGGLGSETSKALVRKGLGTLVILDDDVVDFTNLPRQFFYEADLSKPKAHRLAKNLAKEGFCGSIIMGIPLSFQDARDNGYDLTGTVAVVGVDNNPTRCAASVYYREKQMPVIFTAVSEDASHGYVFVQEPQGPCFACLFPDAVNDETYPCGTPAVIDILKVVAGIVSYAVDSLIMKRLRCWNYKGIFLCGSVPDIAWTIAKRPDCKLCGVAHDERQARGRV